MNASRDHFSLRPLSCVHRRASESRKWIHEKKGSRGMWPMSADDSDVIVFHLVTWWTSERGRGREGKKEREASEKCHRHPRRAYLMQFCCQFITNIEERVKQEDESDRKDSRSDPKNCVGTLRDTCTIVCDVLNDICHPPANTGTLFLPLFTTLPSCVIFLERMYLFVSYINIFLRHFVYIYK